MVNLSSGEYFGNRMDTVENDHLKLCITNYGKKTQIERHDHENSYLSLLFSGSYWEESDGNVDLVSTGDALYRPEGYEHQNYFDQTSGSCFNIEFKPSWYALNRQKTKKNGLYKFKASRFPSLYKLLWSLKVEQPADISLEYVYQWYLEFNQQPNKGNKRWADEVVAILNDEIGRFHSLESLANQVHLHPVYLSRAFKKHIGLTIGEFQIKIKLEKAMDNLLETSKCIGEIAFETGFYDDAHFIRSFKSVYGISPLRFRKGLNG